MSQWNNSYSYNNQYQGPNGWNGDPNGQYMNQAYYPRPDANGQYVSFNDFLAQMQNSNVTQPTNSNTYTSVPYENYTPSQYNYQNMPSSSQSHLNNYNFGSTTSSMPNEVNTYSAIPQSQFNAQNEQNDYKNDVAFKSNLTATAVEFVPKNSAMKPSTSSQNIPDSSSGNSDVKEKVNEAKSTQGSSSDRNWRTRPQSSKQVSDVKDKQVPNGYPQDKSQERNGRNRDQRNNETGRNINKAQDFNEDRESNSKNQELNKRSQETRQRNYDSNNRTQETPTQNYDSNDRSQDSRPRNYESNRIQESRQKNNNSNSRNQDPRQNQNYDSSERNQDSTNRNDRRNQSKGNPKTKNKDDNRTFYNSTISKDSQDVRRGDGSSKNEGLARGEGSGKAEGSGRAEGSARGEGSGRLQRNWAGTQRTRGDRGQDDEQFANNYYQKEDRERDRPERMERDRPDRYQRDERDRDRPERVERDKQDRYQREERDRDRPDRVEKDRQDRYQREERDRDRPERGDRGYDRVERVQKHNPASPARFSKSKHQADLANKEMTQRERLTDQLDKGTLECLVCCDRVRQTDPVWSCSNCYHVMHLRCIRKWAVSSLFEGKWRCPACQNTSNEIPAEYRCMCGGMRAPDYQRGSGAHTCGSACQRPRLCPHPCTLLCHPGPCPPCQATITKQCGCGAETRSVICSSKLPQVCGRTCGRMLECLVHSCTQECHEGDCEKCDEIIKQVCYCPAAIERKVTCTKETGSIEHWECHRACGRILSCGAHVCRATCHPPPCASCTLEPDSVPTCPCGKMKLDKNARKSCTDPIPLCTNICAKPLNCGPSGDKHFCKLICHEGPCPVCPETTLVSCRCLHSSRDIPCADLPKMINNVLCQRKCNKKLSCGRHRCRTVCCVAEQHRCTAPCARSLSCNLHRCQQHCHTGHCPPCPRLSFSELRCECGASVIMPPVRCGARPPACSQPCRRERPCGHPPHHSCHTDECPPCVVLTAKRCYGSHEERKTIPCSLEEFSCGLPCGKPLPCGKHKCIKTCHKGPCDAGKCTQPCTEKRPSCGHVCNAPCHSSAAENTPAAVCPSSTACRQMVRATCPCGRRRAERTCGDNARDHARIMSALAATKMQEGGAIEISEVQRPGSMLKTLECDDECRVEARTRQMALALQIRNPDVSAKLAPRYSDHVRTTATREPAFAQQIHDKLTELVQLAKKSKQKTRAHSFPSMNWQKRQFIHELCEHFGCESVAYDAEPNRNVVATADKEKSWLPAMSIMEVLARETGKRRVPGPVLRAPAAPTLSASTSKLTSGSGWATLTSKSTNAWASRGAPKQTPPEAKIDYFDNPPDN